MPFAAMPSPTSASSGLESTWTRVGPYRMHARVAVGSGRPPIVLVHGLVVSSRYMRPLARRLAPHFSVYVPDLPGFGRSAASEVLDPLRLAEALAGWLEARRLGPASMLAHSFGCQVAAVLAHRRPDLVKRVVLVGPTVDPRGRSLVQPAWRLICDAPEMVRMAPIVLRDLYDAGLWRFVRTYWYMLQDRIEDHLPHVRVPTLVVRGGRDPVAPQKWTEEVAALLPQGCHAVVPDAWHAPNFSKAEALVRVIRPFLNAGDPQEGQQADCEDAASPPR